MIPCQDRLFAPLMAAAAGSPPACSFIPTFRAYRALYADASGRYLQRRGRCCHCYRGGMWPWCLASFAPSATSPETPGADPRRWEALSSVFWVLSEDHQPCLFKNGPDEMQQMAFSQTLGASDHFMLAVIKLAALVVAAASGFRGGRIFPHLLACRRAGADAARPCRSRSCRDYCLLRHSGIGTGRHS